MQTEKLSISLPNDIARGQRLDAIRASLDAAAADSVRHSAAEVTAYFDGFLAEAGKTPRS